MAFRKRIHDIKTAVDYYGKYDRLGNKEIMLLFDCGKSTADKLKRAAKEQEKAEGILSPSSSTVNIKAAYKAWGINIDDLIKRFKQYQKIQKGIAT